MGSTKWYINIAVFAIVSCVALAEDITEPPQLDDPVWIELAKYDDKPCPQCLPPIHSAIVVITRENIKETLAKGKHAVLFWSNVHGLSMMALRWFNKIAESGSKFTIPVAMVACHDYDDVCRKLSIFDFPQILECSSPTECESMFTGVWDLESVEEYLTGVDKDMKYKLNAPMLKPSSLPALLVNKTAQGPKRKLVVGLVKNGKPIKELPDGIQKKIDENTFTACYLDLETELGMSVSGPWMLHSTTAHYAVFDSEMGVVYHLDSNSEDNLIRQLGLIATGEAKPQVKLPLSEPVIGGLIYDHLKLTYGKPSVPLHKLNLIQMDTMTNMKTEL